jgi:diguanylate cyclase (GGDEF)-like protein
MARLAYPLRLAAVATAYFLLAKGCLEFAFRNESVSAIWGPTGLALAATLIGGYRMWPAIAIGAFAANVTTAAPVLAAAGIATGNTLEALVGAVLLRRFADFRLDLGRVKDVFALLVYGAGISTMVSATIGVACLAAAGLVDGGELLPTWRVWWLGDAAGDLIVAPALLVLATRYRAGWLRRPHIRPDAIALLALLAAVALVAFSVEDALVYFVFPVVFWIAFRLQQPGIVVAGLIVAGLAIWFTSEGEGPFVGGSADAELLRAQTFVGVATITGLLAAALMTERARDAEQLRHLADHDQVTGLINRRAFEDELERWLRHSSRYGVPGSVLVIDVDNFKSVNDSLGHPAGDDLLRRLGGALRRRLRETDVVARWGGDEFVVLLPWAGAQRGRMVARVLLEELRAAGSDALEGRAEPVSVSIGVVSFETPDGTGPDDLLARADTTMYAAKREGGDGVYAQNGRGGLERIAVPFRPVRPVRGSALNV